MSIEVADLVASLHGEDHAFTDLMGLASRRIEELGGHTHSAIGLISTLGLGLAGLAVGGLGASVKAALDFNTMMNQLQSNTTLTNRDMVYLQSGILSMATKTSAPLNQLAEGIRHITNFGYSAKDAMVILNEAMMSATTTGGDTGKTAEMLANVMHEFNIQTKDAGHAMDVLHLASAMGNTTLEQFVDTSGKAMAMAANMGVSLNETAAALTALTRHGMQAAPAATLVAGLLSKIANPAKGTRQELAALSKATGIDLVTDFTSAGLKARGLAGVLTDLGLASKSNADEILKLVPATRGGLAAMILTGTGTKDYQQVLLSLNDTFRGKITPTLDAFRRTQQTLGFQLGQLANILTVLGIAIGSVLLPPILKLVTYITGLVLGFQDWVKHSKLVQDAIDFIKAKVADALPYIHNLIDFAGNVVAVFRRFLDQNPAVLNAIKGIGQGLLIFAAGGAAVKAVAATIGILADLALFFTGKTALGVLIRAFAIAWANNWFDMRDKLKTAWDAIQPILHLLADFFNTPIGFGVIGSVIALGGALFLVAAALAAIERVKGIIDIIKGLGGMIGIGGGSSGGGGISAGADADIKALTAAITTQMPLMTAQLRGLSSAINLHIVALHDVINTHIVDLTDEMKGFTLHFPASIPVTVPSIPPVGLKDSPLINAIIHLATTIQQWQPHAGPSGPAGTLSSPDVKALTSAINAHMAPLTTAVTTYFAPLTHAINQWKPSTGGGGGTIQGALGLTTAIDALSGHVQTLRGSVDALKTTITNWKPHVTGGGGGSVTASGTLKLDAGAQAAITGLRVAINQGVPPLTHAINTQFPKLITALGSIKVEVKGDIKGIGNLTKPIELTIGVSAAMLKALALKVSGWMTPAGDMGKAIDKGSKDLALVFGRNLSNVDAWGLAIGTNFNTWATKHATDITTGVKLFAKQAGIVLSDMNNWTLQIEPAFTMWATGNANALKAGVTVLTKSISGWVASAWNAALKLMSSNDLSITVIAIFDNAKVPIDKGATKKGGIVDTLSGWVGGGLKALGSILGGVGGLRDTILGAMGNAVGTLINDFASLTGVSSPAHALTAWVNGAAHQIFVSLTAPVTGVKDQILAAFSGASDWLIGVGGSLIDGLIQGIKNHLPDLQKYLSDLKGLIPGWKGPPSADRVLLVPAGQMIMQGLIMGMRSQQGALSSYLGTVGSTISSTIPQSARSAISSNTADSTVGLSAAVTNLQVTVVTPDGQVLYDTVMKVMGRNARRRVELGGF